MKIIRICVSSCFDLSKYPWKEKCFWLNSEQCCEKYEDFMLVQDSVILLEKFNPCDFLFHTINMISFRCCSISCYFIREIKGWGERNQVRIWMNFLQIWCFMMHSVLTTYGHVMLKKKHLAHTYICTILYQILWLHMNTICIFYDLSIDVNYLQTLMDINCPG